MTPWEIQGTELINCNCSYGCPCQFNALPSKGFCEAMGAISITRGHYGDVPLDGVKIAVVFQWPGPIHAVSYTHLTLPTNNPWCRSRWSPYH